MYQPQEEHLMGKRESDHPIVLRDGRTDHMGKGITVVCSSQKKHMQTSLRGIAKEAKLLLYEANTIEEPYAEKPHAGICKGTVG
ncbi:hypothetical protein [Desulfogranum japonicum]|uniref:hypothetical protein n=1 Tax=Desulfogranum japonicum TaxID=231447 RepID=UPI00048B099C|nr:hypothetical protein [Desulfogranum japonicum]